MRKLLFGWLLIVMSVCSVAIAAERAGKPIELKTAYGTYFDGYLAGSVDSNQSVLLIHDRWGLDSLALTWADKFAAQGYLVLAVDLYDGRLAKKSDDEHATALMRQMAPEWIDANLKAALVYLNAKPGRKVSVVGIGFGGSAAMRATVLEPLSVISTVNVFGRLPQDIEELRGITGPVLVLLSARDKWVGDAEIDNFEKLMSKLRNALQISKVDAKHGFLDPKHDNYKKEEAERIWGRVFSFVAETQ